MGLDIVELIMEVEQEFGLDGWEFSLSEGTVEGLFKCVLDALPPDERQSGAEPFTGPLWERYLDVVARELGVPRASLRPDARFVEDLGSN